MHFYWCQPVQTTAGVFIKPQGRSQNHVDSQVFGFFFFFFQTECLYYFKCRQNVLLFSTTIFYFVMAHWAGTQWVMAVCSRRALYEHLCVWCLAHGYLDSALKVFWHLPPLPEHMFCLHWGLNQDPSTPQPSPQHTQLPLTLWKHPTLITRDAEQPNLHQHVVPWVWSSSNVNGKRNWNNKVQS